MDVTDLKAEVLLLRRENAELRRTASAEAQGQGEIMNQREEIIERLRALELSGGSHEMLSAICRAVAPGAQFGWTQGACDGLRLRLISFLSETDEEALREAYTKGCNDGFDRGFASADDWCAQHEDAMAEHGWVRLPVDADGVPTRVGDVMVMASHPFGCEDKPLVVDRMELSRGMHGEVWCLALDTDRSCWTQAAVLRHYHAPTVEDVLREFFSRYVTTKPKDEDDAIIAEYVAKLRLAGDAE